MANERAELLHVWASALLATPGASDNSAVRAFFYAVRAPRLSAAI